MLGAVSSEASRWFPWTPLKVDEKPLMYCFPYAGAGAAVFRPWALCGCSETVEICPVELPGRGARRAEPPFDSMDGLLAKLLPVLAGHSGGKPVVLFGHSIGGLIAARLAGELLRAGLPVEHVFVSATEAPGSGGQSRPFSSMAADELVQELTSLGGTPPELLAAPTFLSELLPRLRADLALRDEAGVASVPTPLTVFSGACDRIAAPAAVEGWRAFTTGEFTHHRLPDNHFFLRDRRNEILALVDRALRPVTDFVGELE
jgi:medium-chain acyl-[acyl-carrier-protein] hydrolase